MNSQFETERKKMTSWAFRVTILYVAFLVFLAVTLAVAGRAAEIGGMKPNEVGDLLAGVGGPFALIWLVYGYFLQGLAIRQQAEELRQNTRALHLQEEALRAQVAELNSAVQQQKEMVEIARNQLQFQLESFKEERVREQRQVTPILKLRVEKKRHGLLTRPADGWGTFNATLSNIGGIAIDVSVTPSEDLQFLSSKSTGFLKRDDNFQITLAKVDSINDDPQLVSRKSSTLVVVFSDVFDARYAYEFTLLMDEKNAYTGEVFSHPLGSD